MIHTKAYLSEKVFDEAIEKGPTRDGFGLGSVEVGKVDERVVVLCADLAESTRASWFQKEFPDRYIEIGVAEQNLATVASGLANYGKIPFITSYAAFSPGRNLEQIRTTIALSNLHVVICGMHAGVSVGPDGATHQPLEDIAMMRAMPNMIVVAPSDVEEARKATVAAAKIGKPIYLRFARAATPLFTTEKTPFEIGKAEVFWQGENPQVAIIACGALVHNALKAAKELEGKGVSVTVINNHTIKPLDSDTILKHAKECGAVVTVEEHQQNGGLGGAVAEILAKHSPLPQEFVGVDDSFGQSGEPEELIEHYKLGVSHIVLAVERAVARK